MKEAGDPAASGGQVPSSVEHVDGRVSRAQRLRAQRRQQVRQAARRLFAQRGYHDTSIQDILQEAGIARGTFYLHFDSKRAVFDDLVDDFLDRIRSMVRRVDTSPGAPPPLVQIEQNLSRVMDVLSSDRDMTRILLHLAQGLDKDCDAKVADFYDRVLLLLGGALEQGQRMGLLRPCDSRVVAQAALGSLKEVVLHWIVRRDSAREEVEHVIREILRFALEGLFR
ncbi:MAG: TetR/AcrR family transcriptional regulator [Myxococcales bacterium]|nr:TetR/AcrR family transcriptional regulator [Myxococcota bacterium]MDW8280607.1 TetR/AcrR family transcriptional regulator [Myxococcales bacterium]